MNNIQELQDIETMCVRADGGPETSKVAFDKLESKLDTLKGRKFYGALQNGVYRACVELTDADEPEKHGFERYTIPGGRYAREKIDDWIQHIPEIPKTFEDMKSQFNEDETRPGLEFYRSQKELILFLPIKVE